MRPHAHPLLIHLPPSGISQTWEPHERLPTASVRELLTRYLDITTPPTSNFLHLLAEYAHDNDHRTRLEQLATVGNIGRCRWKGI